MRLGLWSLRFKVCDFELTGNHPTESILILPELSYRVHEASG